MLEPIKISAILNKYPFLSPFTISHWKRLGLLRNPCHGHVYEDDVRKYLPKLKRLALRRNAGIVGYRKREVWEIDADICMRIAMGTKLTQSGCWEWTKSSQGIGYGAMGIHPRSSIKKTLGSGYNPMAVHRVAYMIFVGPIPNKLVIDHLCRNRRCCNPAHLEAVTQAENILRGEGPAAVNTRKTHCKWGHRLSGSNLLMKKRSLGGDVRVCRKCRLIRDAAKRKKIHEAKTAE